MVSPPWKRADRSLTLEQARAALEGQFPKLAPAHLAFVGSGWDNDVYQVNEVWIFRFPRRRNVADGIPFEIAAMDLVNRMLAGGPLRTPVFAWRGEAGPHFPYPFLGYRQLPGVAGDAVPEDRLDRPALARSLGDALGRLHRADVEEARRAGAESRRYAPSEWRDRLEDQWEGVRGLLPAELVAACTSWLAEDPPVPEAYAGPACLLHNDVCPDHVLVDAATGRPTALIDFADMALGDPVRDFVALWCWLGRRFTEEVLAHYPLPLDVHFWERLAYLARVCSLCWLAETIVLEQPDARPKHIAWVHRAFEMTPSPLA